MEMLAIFAGVLAATGVSIWGVILLGNWFSRLPMQLRGHAFAALIWGIVAFVQTLSLLESSSTPNVIGHLVVFVAGWTMVSSWRQFAEQRRGVILPQNRRWLMNRLFVQSFWGPLALWLCIFLLFHLGMRLFDSALTRRDLTTAFLLRHYGFGNIYDEEYGYRLADMVEAGDMEGVNTYLAVGVDPEGGYHRSEPLLVQSLRQRNVAITRLILQYGVFTEPGTYWNYDHPLHTAVAIGNVRHVQALLQHGANRKVLNNAGETPFQVAKKRKDTAMVAALTAQYPIKASQGVKSTPFFSLSAR